MLGIPPLLRSGFNDGVVYPPSDVQGPSLSPSVGSPPTKQLSLRMPGGPTTLNCLVLLVDFPDMPGQQTKKHYESLLFDPIDKGSMHRFYKEMSHGQLTVKGHVTDWLRADHPYSYYANNMSGTGDTFPRNVPGLLQEILGRYCATNSLKPFDLNGDDYLDGLFLIHAGSGAEAATDAAQRKALIWSHKWTLPQPFVNDGVNAYAYFTAPEDGRLGVFAHEFGHFLGLPDLYDTSYRSLGVGPWCLMGGGSWNGGGDHPSRLSAWCLAELGWVSPQTVAASGRVTLDTLEREATACHRIDGPPGSREYFLLENRQRTGRDSHLPGSGLALWHIDEAQESNANPPIYRVALIQADGRRDLQKGVNPDDPEDLFPGPRGVRSVDDRGDRHPHTRWNDGTASGIALTDISEEDDGTIALDISIDPVAVA
ncbi:M6 family metalloprotease domain-containing protein [Methylobacterium sp. 174MFSha1.1]|uniref:M6 family metalloprotease domain-containing protein n=1 Tax=Methylobacterium sp. 174MFSha1.1 TaxID=1502749 RepID=UPI0015A518FB|nr:M6 family metalloprotease domain-containing protein [Methylobacterium sp. 174MFSha1.1]